MNQRASIIVAAVLTGFVLVTIGAVIGSGAEPEPQAQPFGASELERREAEWRELIDQANRRLAEAEQPPAESYVTAEYPEPRRKHEHRRKHDDHDDHHDDDDDDDD